MSITSQNPWGRSASPQFEVQRKDLWAVDLSQAFGGIKQYVTSEFSDGFVNSDFLAYCAQSVTFPDALTRAKVYNGIASPINLPDHDDALGAINITFIVDADAKSRNVSAAHAFLEAWRMVVRQGRGGLTGGGLASGASERVPALTAANNYRIPFQWNIPVVLYKGLTVNPGFVYSSIANTSLPSTNRYTLVDAWLSGYQISELSYDGGNAIHTIRATFYAQAVLSSPALASIGSVPLGTSTSTTATADVLGPTGTVASPVPDNTPTIANAVIPPATQATTASLLGDSFQPGSAVDQTAVSTLSNSITQGIVFDSPGAFAQQSGVAQYNTDNASLSPANTDAVNNAKVDNMNAIVAGSNLPLPQ